MGDLEPLRREIRAARDQARTELDRALACLSQCSKHVEGAWDEARESVLRDVAGKLHDLLLQEELLAALESVAMSQIYDIEPSIQRLARKSGGVDDGGSTPLG
jgi:hypothetical protein